VTLALVLAGDHWPVILPNQLPLARAALTVDVNRMIGSDLPVVDNVTAAAGGALNVSLSVAFALRATTVARILYRNTTLRATTAMYQTYGGEGDVNVVSIDEYIEEGAPREEGPQGGGPTAVPRISLGGPSAGDGGCDAMCVGVTVVACVVVVALIGAGVYCVYKSWQLKPHERYGADRADRADRGYAVGDTGDEMPGRACKPHSCDGDEPDTPGTPETPGAPGAGAAAAPNPSFAEEREEP
jgi:hypothetical protein